MREIKFRAWIKFEKLMVDVSDLYYDRAGWNKVVGSQELVTIAYRKNKEANRSDFEIMQYTGLKDKNGKEIYEGDIVEGARKYEVKMDDFERYGWLPFSQDDGCGCCSSEVIYDPENCEVIGNIYENPELLEVKK